MSDRRDEFEGSKSLPMVRAPAHMAKRGSKPCPSARCSCGRDQGYCEECNGYHHWSTWDEEHAERQHEMQVWLLLNMNPMFKHDRSTFIGSLGMTQEEWHGVMDFTKRLFINNGLLFSQKAEVALKKYKGSNGELALALIMLGRMHAKRHQQRAPDTQGEGATE